MNYHVFPESQRRDWLSRSTHPILKSVIAQDDALETVTDLCFLALGRADRCLPLSICFIGGPSTGKTFLARALKDVLGTPYAETDASRLKNPDSLIDTMLEAWSKRGIALSPSQVYDSTEVYRMEPMVCFIDEIHGLSRGVQDSFLKALERGDGMLFGKKRVVDCRRVTFVGGTTEWGHLGEAFRTRMRPIQLYPYTAADVEEMVHRRKRWDRGLCARVVHYAGTVPRECRDFCDMLEAAAARQGCGIEGVLVEVARREGIDEWGMRRQRVAILQACRQPVLLRHLAGSTGIPAEDLLKVWLPPMLTAPKGAMPMLQFSGEYQLTAVGRMELEKRGL